MDLLRHGVYELYFFALWESGAFLSGIYRHVDYKPEIWKVKDCRMLVPINFHFQTVLLRYN